MQETVGVLTGLCDENVRVADADISPDRVEDTADR